ncbi:YbjQ family protein [uncultured Helicobacter sp.]|uniref:YbjQ family protein n=1 Tax=uncultured Helicobacter sp. TaxID=175537 RepID=UPI00374E9613
MKLYSIEYLPQMRYEVLGLVKGNVVRSKHIGRDIMAALKNIVGGELVGYTEMLSEARDIATQRMNDEARNLGADAIIGIKYTTSSISQGTTEVLVYGTAVKMSI